MIEYIMLFLALFLIIITLMIILFLIIWLKTNQDKIKKDSLMIEKEKIKTLDEMSKRDNETIKLQMEYTQLIKKESNEQASLLSPTKAIMEVMNDLNMRNSKKGEE